MRRPGGVHQPGASRVGGRDAAHRPRPDDMRGGAALGLLAALALSDAANIDRPAASLQRVDAGALGVVSRRAEQQRLRGGGATLSRIGFGRLLAITLVGHWDKGDEEPSAHDAWRCRWQAAFGTIKQVFENINENINVTINYQSMSRCWPTGAPHRPFFVRPDHQR